MLDGVALNNLFEMPKITFEKIVKADRNRVFDIAANYEEFEKTLPQYFPSIRVRSCRDNVAVVEEHLCVAGKELVMMTKHVTAYPEIHEVFVIGGDAKGSHIFEKYEIVPEGTKITVEANIKLKGAMKLAGFFAKGKISKSFSKIMDEFAKIAEG
jgi:coenzyme Q-binding protein COQ10